MRIGVVSDTHGSLRAGAKRVLADSDHIIHAGDICASSVLEDLEDIAPLTAVLGNCDYDDFGPDVHEEADVTLGGVRFHVVHRLSDLGALDPGHYDVVVSGHTHRAVVEHANGVLLVNPGSVTQPRGGGRPTVAIVEVADGVVKSAQIVPVG